MEGGALVGSSDLLFKIYDQANLKIEKCLRSRVMLLSDLDARRKIYSARIAKNRINVKHSKCRYNL